MLNFNWENWIYIVSISCQLAAAFLLVGNIDVSQKGINKEFCKVNRTIAFEINGKLADDSFYRDTIRNSWINFFAYIYLGIGYFSNIFGKTHDDTKLMLCFIVILVTALIIFTHKFAKYKAKKAKEFTLDDVIKEGAVAWIVLESLEDDGIES